MKKRNQILAVLLAMTITMAPAALTAAEEPSHVSVIPFKVE